MAEAVALPPAVDKKSRNGGDQQPSNYGDPGAQPSRRQPHGLNFLTRHFALPDDIDHEIRMV